MSELDDAVNTVLGCFAKANGLKQIKDSRCLDGDVYSARYKKGGETFKISFKLSLNVEIERLYTDHIVPQPMGKFGPRDRIKDSIDDDIARLKGRIEELIERRKHV